MANVIASHCLLSLKIGEASWSSLIVCGIHWNAEMVDCMSFGTFGCDVFPTPVCFGCHCILTSSRLFMHSLCSSDAFLMMSTGISTHSCVPVR